MAEIRDRESLEAWLNTQPREASLAIAARAALRVQPLLLGTLDLKLSRGKPVDAIISPLFHGTAMPWFIALVPNHGISDAAGHLASSAEFTADSAASLDRSKKSASLAAARSASTAANFADTGSKPTRTFAALAATYAADSAFSAAGSAIWNTVSADVTMIELQGINSLREASLWPNGETPEWIAETWKRFRVELLLDKTLEFHVWTDWYEARLRGGPVDLDEQRIRAGMEQQIWLKKGAAAYNAELKQRLSEAGKWPSPPEMNTPPDQRPAPVLVDVRNGKVAPTSTRDSKLLAADRDFEQWRQPVQSHLGEMLAGDFKQGTNHSRARERLSSLEHLLTGSIPDLKERQFTIGYEIDRLAGLVAAYRVGGDDMPTLTQAVLEDLDRLHLGLKLGISKLERWAEFQQSISNEPSTDAATRAEIAAALESMASNMDGQPKYFDPELPRTFRWLAEAMRDPFGASKAVVYGSVRSGENLLAFLGQRALGIGKKTIEGVEEGISRATSAALLVGLSTYAHQLAQALPTNLGWLKPLLEKLSKGLGG